MSNDSKNTDNTYPYSKYILPPESIGSSPAGNALENDVKAIIAYVQVLTSGNSRAQTIGPLGNQYFLNTGGKCKDTAGVKHDRYVYINNIPDGSMPFVSNSMWQLLILEKYLRHLIKIRLVKK